MTITDIVSKSKILLDGNAPAILASLGVAGTIGTAVLTGKASFKASTLIREKELELKLEQLEEIKELDRKLTEEELSSLKELDQLDRKEKLQLVWQLYIPPVLVGAGTITAIVMANRVAAKQIAALAVASGITERAFQEYKEKVIEKLGSTKDTAIRDAVAQDRVDKYPIGTNEVILAGTGDVLCFDILTGRYFQSNVEAIRRAENTVNFEIVNHMYASLSTFYDEIGLPATPYSDTVGWNVNNRCEVKISTVMSSDNRPCAAIDFHFLPIAEYGKLY